MTDLIEQLKKGELQEGFYYVRCAWSDEVEIRYVHNGVDDWQEIIAEVPTYDEWKAAYECQLMESELVVTLKELLKKCRDILEDEGDYMIVQKIDEVLL